MSDLDYYQASPLGWKHGAIIVWAGMRGVVTLAAAQTLPRDDTSERALLVFVAFAVAVGSLMLQGFTLPWVVRLLRLDRPGDDSLDKAEQSGLDDELRDAAAAALSDPALRRRDGTAFPAELVDRRRQPHASNRPTTRKPRSTRDLLELRLAMIEAMRARLNELSSGGGVQHARRCAMRSPSSTPTSSASAAPRRRGLTAATARTCSIRAADRAARQRPDERMMSKQGGRT